MRINKGLELKRQLFHMFFGIVIVILLYYHIFNAWILCILLIFGVFMSIVAKYKRVGFIDYMLRNFDRQGTEYPGNGAVTYMIGVVLTVLIFDSIFHKPNIAYASIFILAVGDSLSTLGGIFFGRTRNPLNENKTVEGTVIGIVFGFVATLVFVTPVAGLLASIVAMTLEALDKNYLMTDDNIFIPIIGGFVLLLYTIL
jgi:phytol kinase